MTERKGLSRGNPQKIIAILNLIRTKQQMSNVIEIYKRIYKGKKAVNRFGMEILDNSGDLTKHLRLTLQKFDKKYINQFFQMLRKWK